MFFGVVLALLATLIAASASWWYLSYRKWRTYWRDRGVSDGPTWEEMKRNWLVMSGKASFGEFVRATYERTRSSCVWYHGSVPTLVVRDPQLLEEILVKEFASFQDRGVPTLGNQSAVDLGLATLTGNKWKAVRSKVSPAFTTGKLRDMLRGMAASSAKALGRDLPACDGVDVLTHLANYALDTIGSTVFGLDTLESSRFREMSRRMTDISLGQRFRFFVLLFAPRLAKKFNVKVADEEAVAYFEGLVRTAFDSKKVDGVRNDFVSLLMQLKEKGRVELKLRDTEEEDGYLQLADTPTANTLTVELTDELLFAQAFQFLTAGLEGTSLTMLYLVHELAHNPKVQEKLRTEIEDVLHQNYGQLTYDTLKKMTYLHQCILECLRKYPPAPILMRVCVRDCQLKGGLRIESGTQVMVPVWGIHWDPEYYPDPEQFTPERFTPEGISSRPNCTFLAFGDGPRMCIGRHLGVKQPTSLGVYQNANFGMRFALLEVKVGIVSLLTKYRLEPSANTKLPLQFSPSNFLISPKYPIYVTLKKLPSEKKDE